ALLQRAPEPLRVFAEFFQVLVSGDAASLRQLLPHHLERADVGRELPAVAVLPREQKRRGLFAVLALRALRIPLGLFLGRAGRRARRLGALGNRLLGRARLDLGDFFLERRIGRRFQRGRGASPACAVAISVIICALADVALLLVIK